MDTTAARLGTHDLDTARWQVTLGRVASGIAIAFLAFDSGIKVVEAAPAIAGTTQLGFGAGAVFGLGVLELACLVAYCIPRTSLLGAVLLTGWFGGAIASHLRLGSPLATHTLSPVYVAIFVWGGLWLRRADLRKLVLNRTRG